jgi:thymidylate synthase (FAD)
MEIKVLDHGYVRFVEDWGKGDAGEAEAGMVEAARQSTQGSFRGWDQDERLLRFLYTHDPKHATPFEFAGMVIEVQAPIFVFREWHRHRTQSYNEMSARYSPLPDLNYVPTVDRLIVNSATNKQAGTVKGAEELTETGAREFQDELRVMYNAQEEFYQKWLARGVPKELARVDLPVGRYSRMRACTSLRNWLAFLTLRMDPMAQWEIRQFANAVGEIIKEKFPRTWDLFDHERTRPTRVCLCGSTRFPDAFIQATREETLAGKIVLSVGLFGHQEGIDMSGPVKAALDALHLRKIDLADEILFLNVGGYMGESTRRELDYARARGKKVRFLEEV